MPLDADDISRLYHRHARGLVTFFVRRTYDPEAAVDLLAETFAVVVADRSRFRGTGDDAAQAWIFGIARNLLNGWFRHARVERAALQRLGLEPPDCGEGEFRRIEDLAGLAQLRERVAASLDALSQDDRVVLDLRIVAERDYSEVAAALGVSEDSARARVSRALKRLAAIVETSEEAMTRAR